MEFCVDGDGGFDSVMKINLKDGAASCTYSVA
jgi:hypothetical protein